MSRHCLCGCERLHTRHICQLFPAPSRVAKHQSILLDQKDGCKDIRLSHTFNKISIFKEDNAFSIIVNLPYGPAMNTDNGYLELFVSDAKLDGDILKEEKPVLAL